jgi:hypothetical protein
VLIGCTVAIEHVVALALGVENPDIHLPPGWWGSASLLVLLVPAVIAAHVGVGLRRIVYGRRAASVRVERSSGSGNRPRGSRVGRTTGTPARRRPRPSGEGDDEASAANRWPQEGPRASCEP